MLAAALRMLAARARDPEEKYVQALAAIVRQGSGAVQLTPDACWTAANGILYCRSVLKLSLIHIYYKNNYTRFCPVLQAFV